MSRETMDIPRLRERSLEGGDEDRVDRSDRKCETCGTLKSSGNPACSTCSNGADSRRPNGNVDEMEPNICKVPFTKQGCIDSDDSTIESLNDGDGERKSADGNQGGCDVAHRSSGNNQDSGDGDIAHKTGTSKGGPDDIVDKSSRNPYICSNKGSRHGDVDYMSGRINGSSATDEFGLNLHRDYLIQMSASHTLGGKRYDQPQPQQEQGGAEGGNQDEDSRPVQPNKAHKNVESLSVTNDNDDSSYVALETPTSSEELLAPDIQNEEGSGSIDVEKAKPGGKPPSTDSDHYDSNPVVPDLESLATDMLCLATDDFTSDQGQRTNEPAVVEGLAAAESLTAAERLEAWLEQDRQQMADLPEASFIGYDSWPSEEEALAIEQAVQWDMLRCIVVVFAFVILSLISLSE